MSTIEAKIVKVEIKNHPNADRLELAYIGGEGGYISVVKKDQFKNGDLAIYIPVDSVIPENISSVLKVKNKIAIKDGRIRCTKIRQVFSEGICLEPAQWLNSSEIIEGKDVTVILGIKKYEPPPPNYSNDIKSVRGVNFNYKNPNFPEYWCVEHLKKYPKVLKDGENVVATIKWHGTNFRCGYVRKPKPKGIVQRLKRLLFDRGEFEYLVGSHKKIKKLTPNAEKYGAREKDIYLSTADKYKMESVTKSISSEFGCAEVVIYAEIVGPGIQKGYDYGIDDTREIRVFDIMINRKYLNWDSMRAICIRYNLPTVQEVYRGPWIIGVREYANAIDEYNGRKFVREGIVIRPTTERKDPHCGRVILKHINEEFALNKTNSEYH